MINDDKSFETILHFVCVGVMNKAERESLKSKASASTSTMMKIIRNLCCL